jgi:ABC-type branched-subunit amino acid transport system substrate-binding protein
MKKSLILVAAIVCAACLVFTGVSCKTAATTDTTAAATTAAATTAAAETNAAETTAAAAKTTPITIGHGTFWTGPYASVGPRFAAAADFTLEIINQNPPLGEKVRIIHSDEGTIGEQQWVMKDVDSNKVDILLNVGYEYLTYRDWLLKYIKDNNRPLLPSVHGGSIGPQYGGTAEEPIFRGSPQDVDQGIAAVLRAVDLGAKTCVIVGGLYDSAQQQKDIAVAAAPLAGLEVLSVIDVELEKTYRAEVAAAQALKPDAMIIFLDASGGGLMVKTIAEAGMSTIVVGVTDWQFVDFVNTATMEAIKKQKAVDIVGFAPMEGPAWDFYSKLWDGNPQYAAFNAANDSYTMQYYDVITCTMLAIKKSGSLDVANWAKAMHEVANAPGKEVYSYKEGFDAIEAGEDINYIGPTGTFDYSATGVVNGTYGVSAWTDLTTLAPTAIIDGARVVEIAAKIPPK